MYTYPPPPRWRHRPNIIKLVGLALGYVLLFNNMAFSQSYCDPLPVHGSCLLPSTTYTCVGSNVGLSTFSAAISASQLVSAANSASTIQYVIIDGTFEMGSITGYTFKSGSDLIFAEDALLLINSSASGQGNPNLKILGSTLRGCEDLWEGIKVLQGRGILIENSELLPKNGATS